MQYKILLSPYMWLMDDDVIIEWKDIKDAFFRKYWKYLHIAKMQKSDVVIWTGKKRIWFMII